MLRGWPSIATAQLAPGGTGKPQWKQSSVTAGAGTAFMDGRP
ncbi:hypothetical protein GJA_5441 [Janthinobacterium agaricidamnosum NBRC 102515 = DSM 9628]|uniref:Uncharacterized protein n=1 Tax=Janthinobacterium agaricidamnosum NBRC 102515 = DSM 9628 TaxID=1349767 RepID=W0VDP3_9BURK|nr:hypothetical protein GJA_5441 [Janthinobacterium agaricidamnosum NBRC 102515 = DSM 9628]